MPAGILPQPFRPFDVQPDADRTHERYPQPRGQRSAHVLDMCRLPSSRPSSGPSPLCLRWLDSSPGDIPLATIATSPGPWLRVRLKGESATLRGDFGDPRALVDDLGADFQVRARADCSDGVFGYSAILQLTSTEWAAMTALAGSHPKPRFSLFTTDPRTNQDRVVVHFDDDTPVCSRAETLYCLDQFDPAAPPEPIACHGPLNP
jgi:hypothetical protein